MGEQMKVTCMLTFKWASDDPSKEGTVGELRDLFEQAVVKALKMQYCFRSYTIDAEVDYVGLDVDWEVCDE